MQWSDSVVVTSPSRGAGGGEAAPRRVGLGFFLMRFGLASVLGLNSSGSFVVLVLLVATSVVALSISAR
eukprot:scaffold297947_cov38-Prasinocladus_malaysianus.AAC.1